VLVVREHEVLAARMEIEGVAEELHRHRGALDMPAGPAITERRLPGGLAGLSGLPEREVAGGILVVFIDIDARTVFDTFKIFLRQLSVLGKARDAEVPGAVFGAVGNVFGGKALNE